MRERVTYKELMLGNLKLDLWHVNHLRLTSWLNWAPDGELRPHVAQGHVVIATSDGTCWGLEDGGMEAEGGGGLFEGKVQSTVCLFWATPCAVQSFFNWFTARSGYRVLPSFTEFFFVPLFPRHWIEIKKIYDRFTEFFLRPSAPNGVETKKEHYRVFTDF